MPATTIKIETPLLNELKKFIAKGESLSAFIRKVLTKDIQRRKMIQAAEAYAQFLDINPEEQKWLEQWETADLTLEPKRKRRIKKHEKR